MFTHILVLIMGLMTAEMAFAQTSAAGQAKPIKMVVLGDSLSAGLGLSGSAAFPERLQKSLETKGIKVDMINAGVSGDTASGGRDRLDWSVPEGTEAVILELGANDALRGTDPNVTRSALTDILTRLKARKVAVLLCGMLAPPNYGGEYAARFNAIYPDLAKSFGVPLYPFFLGGRGRHREEYSAHGGGISRHDCRATQLKNRQYPGGFQSVNATCFAESHKSGRK